MLEVINIIIVVVTASGSSSSRGTLRLHVSLLPTTIAYDLGFLTIFLDMSSLHTVVTDDLAFWIRTSTVELILGRSESGFETPIWGWFGNCILLWLDTSPLLPLILDLSMVILESDCRVNKFLEL
jgi:hypothetical protein